MKRLVLVLFVVMTALCFTWALAAPEEFDGAAAFVPGQTVNVNIAAGEKGKYFSFTPQRDGSFLISSGNRGSSDPYVVLYDEAGDVIDKNNDGSVDVNFLLNAFLESGNTYYILCTDYDIYGENMQVSSNYDVFFDNSPLTPDGFEYYIDYNDAVITGYTGTGGDVVLPSQIDEFTVCRIVSMSSDDIKTLTIPAGVCDIDYGAFAKCPNLTGISVSDENSYFKSVDGVLYSGGNILYAYPAAKEGSYTVPTGADLGLKAFMNARVSSVTLPDSIFEIFEHRFYNCLNLTSVFIPANVCKIDGDAFYNCPNLTIYGDIGSYAHRYANENNIPFKLTNDAFDELKIGTPQTVAHKSQTFIVKPDVTACYAFDITENYFVWSSVNDDSYAWINRKSYELGSNKAIEYYLLEANKSYYVTFKPESVTDGTYTVNMLRLPDNGEGLYYHNPFDDVRIRIIAYTGSESEVTIPAVIDGKQVKKINSGAFKDCVNLINVNIPGSVEDIGRNAFENCSSLKDVVISEGVYDINDEAFKNCQSLESITIPASVEAIGYDVFAGCPKLTIKGAIGSRAHKCALDNDIPFESMNETIELELDKPLTVEHKTQTFTVKPGITSCYRFDIEGEGYVWSSVSDEELISVDSKDSMGIGDNKIVMYYILEAEKSYYVTCAPDNATDGTYTVIMSRIPRTENGFYYNSVRDDNQLDIIAYVGNESEVTIPASIDGKNVTGIGYTAFEDCTCIKSVIIPEGVTYIGSSAFYNCINLESVSLPKTLKDIGLSAFSGCSSLKSVDIPEGVTYIHDSTFSRCTSLESVTIPSSVINIYANVFSGCSKLKDITIPSNVTYMGNNIFYNCPNLTIRGEIGSYAQFYAKEYNIPFEPINKAIELDIDTPVTVAHKSQTFIVKPTVTSYYMFDVKGENCVLTNVTDDKFVSVSIVEGLYYSLTNTVSYYRLEADKSYYVFCSPSETTQGSYKVAFSQVPCTKDGLFYHDSFANGNIRVIAYDGDGGDVTVPSGLGDGKVTEIVRRAFSNHTSLTSVVLPDTLEYIYYKAFSNCQNLESITIPASVTHIESAFEGCAKLTIHGEIGSRAQSYAKEYNIPFEPINEAIELALDTPLTFGDKSTVFSVKPTVTSYYIFDVAGKYSVWPSVMDDGLVNVERKSGRHTGVRTASYFYLEANKEYFIMCSPYEATEQTFSITVSVVPRTENGLYYNAIFADDSLYIIAYTGNETDVSIPTSIGSKPVFLIDEGAFKDCAGIKSVSIPDGASSIGRYAFENCANLEKAIIPESITGINSDAFKNCPKLTIYGIVGSDAHIFAKDNSIPFKALNYTPNSGDVNLDGETDEKDALFIIEALAGNGLTADEINAGDVNKDGAASLKDAVLILRR